MSHVISAAAMRAMVASVRKDPASLAILLLESGPAPARRIALAMQERAARELDGYEAERWALVVDELARRGDVGIGGRQADAAGE
jgi:hypothetical protein